MTREQIIAAVKDAGIKAGYLGSYYSSTEALERFYASAFEAGRATERDESRQQLAAKQAEVAALMLEYCPNEMPQEQLDNWAAHQRPSEWKTNDELRQQLTEAQAEVKELEADLDAALKMILKQEN